MSIDRRPSHPCRARPFVVAVPVAVPLLALSIASCSSEPGLRVGEVQFTADDIRGLPDSQIDLLVAITAVGIATAGGEPLEAVSPALEAGRGDARMLGLRRTLALERMNVSEAALEARYATDPDYELTVRHLVVLSEPRRSESERAEARARAQAALARADAGEPFPQLAGRVSEEPGAAERGGLLEPGREGTWVDEFWDAARSLEVGETSDVVETEYGFHVIRLEDRRVLPFSEARGRVAADVAREIEDRGAWEAWIAEISGMPIDSVRSAYPNVPEEARAALLGEAERRGIGVAEADEAALLRAWASRLAGWAGLLGFEPGMTTEAIGEQALAALGATGQNARLARDEVGRWGEVLLAAYPVERPGP